jgi:broad specificity phosphatase PhoE
MSQSDSNSSVFLIRHAQSNWNVAEHAALARRADIYEYKFNLDLVDPGISDFGLDQTKEASDLLKDVPIKVVFTSPFRRCLQTTYNIFKDHQEKPHVIVLPILREIFSSACDVSDDIKAIKKEFPEFDFSMIDELEIPEMWLFHSLQNETLRREFLEEAKRLFVDRTDIGEQLKQFKLDKLREYYPNQYESGFDIIERNAKAKKIIGEKIRELGACNKIALVAHYFFLQSFTASEFSDEGMPLNGKGFNNCEVYEHKL